MSPLTQVAEGVRALRRHRTTAISLYLVQLGVAVVFMMIVAWVLNMLYGHHPLFDRGVAGDDFSLFMALAPHMATVKALAIVGFLLAFAYGVLSLYLSAGLVGAFAGVPFGQAAGRWFPAFARLALVALVPYAIGAALAFIGGNLMAGGIADTFSLRVLVGRPILGALPGLLLMFFTSCAVDYARVVLVTQDRRGALRAFGRGWATILRRPGTLVHYGLYVLFWIAITALYVAGTIGHPYGGALGLWLLFAARQVVAMLRFSARFMASGGQVAYLTK